jgi:hypothetical protein
MQLAPASRHFVSPGTNIVLNKTFNYKTFIRSLNHCFLGYDAVGSGRSLLTARKRVRPLHYQGESRPQANILERVKQKYRDVSEQYFTSIFKVEKKQEMQVNGLAPGRIR